MLNTTATTATPAFLRSLPVAPAAEITLDEAVNQRACQTIVETLKLVHGLFAPQRRMVHAGDVIYQTGEHFGHLYLLNSGFFKVVNLSLDGREQVVGLKFRGDWLGFDGIANGRYTCDAVAMDTGEVWTLRYDRMLAPARASPIC